MVEGDGWKKKANNLNDSLPVPFSNKTVGYLSAGALARLAGAIVTSPLDTVKTRLQFQQKLKSNAEMEVRTYKGSINAFRRMFVEEGVLSFYRGLPARLLYNVPSAAVSFLFYEQFRTLFHQPKLSAKSYMYTLLPLMAGGLARVTGTALRTPFDIVKQRMQIQGSILYKIKPTPTSQTPQKNLHAYRNTFHAFSVVFRKEGLMAFWAGYGATILRDLPFSFVYFLSYEYIKTVQGRAFYKGTELDNDPTVALKTRNHIAAGALAAACAVVATMPMDVVKTRLQTQGSLTYRKYNGIYHCFRTILVEEGVKGLTTGLGPRLIYLVPSSALTFSLYEAFKRLISHSFYNGTLR